MKVRLIAHTTGAVGTEYEGRSIDEIIVGIARLSSSREDNDKFAEPHKLIRHCLLNGHWSVFTMSNLIFEIETSRAMGREMLRHWSIRPQEFSQRYAEIIGYEEVEIRKQGKTNRQMSDEVFDPVVEFNTTASELVRDTLDTINRNYGKLTAAGVSREVARFIAPECATTRLIMNGTPREWITTLNQRLHSTAQKECRMIAEGVRDYLIHTCPVISRAMYYFENAELIPILDQMTLRKYKVYDQVLEAKTKAA